MSKKKFNLKNPLKLMEDFAAGELDNSATTATDTKPTVKVDQSNQSGAEIRAEIIADVDAILTNLETLSKQIQEGFEQIKQDVLDGNKEVLELFSSVNESTLVLEKDATLGELMGYSEDDYEYLKAEAKKLGVTVTVHSEGDPESMYDDMGYDTLSFKGPKEGVLKVAAISGHDQDLCPENDPDCGGYVLQMDESAEVNEEDNTISKKVMDLIWYKNKANKAMDKVNKVKQNAVAIDLAAKGLDGSDKQEKAKKDKLVAKAKSAKEKGDELEKAVRDKFDDRSVIVQKAIQKKDIEGRLASIKQETGMSEDPKKSKELKDKMKDLQTQLKKEDDAIKQIETDAAPEVDDAKDALQKYKDEEKKLKDKGYKAQALKDGEEGDEVTLNHPETGNQVFSKPKDEKKGSFDEEKAQAAIDKAKDAKEAYTSVDGNNNPVKIAELEIAVLTAELAMAEGKGEDAEKIQELKDKIKAAEVTSKRKVVKVEGRPESGKNSKDDMIARYQKLIDGTDDPEKKKKYQDKIDGLQEESEERFLDAEFMSVLEAELLEFEKELSEGNAFGAARAEAIAKGEKTFKVGDEEYDVEAVGADDKENAEEYAEEEGIAKEAVSESASFKLGSVADRFRSLM